MNDSEQTQRLDDLLARFTSAMKQLFDTAYQLEDDLDEAEDRAFEGHGDSLPGEISSRVRRRMARRHRRLHKVRTFSWSLTKESVAWSEDAHRIYYERPTGSWRRWRQRRRLRSIVKHGERWAADLEAIRTGPSVRRRGE